MTDSKYSSGRKTCIRDEAKAINFVHWGPLGIPSQWKRFLRAKYM